MTRFLVSVAGLETETEVSRSVRIHSTLGRMIESGKTKTLFDNPLGKLVPSTAGAISAVASICYTVATKC